MLRSLEEFARASMKRAARGLYHGKEVMFGNNVSFSQRKTRRRWNPNIQKKTFYSDILQRWLPLRVSTKAIRCIDKAGGLDNYILNTPERRFGPEGSRDLALDLRQQLTEAAQKKDASS